MATVVNMTNPITGAVEQVDKLDHTAQQIDDAVAMALQLSNPNLLDNWYFGNPVNQRGQTEYTGSLYSVDRWRLQGGNCNLVDDGLLITSSARGQIFVQRFTQEMQTALSGKTVTFSVLATIKSGEFYLTDTSGFSASHVDVKMQTGVTSWTFSVANFNSIAGLGWWGNGSGAQILVHAAKLELGSQQTLAHQDAGGDWVLNEIPDYSVELLKCQRYFYPSVGRFTTLYANTTTSAIFGINLPTAMRTTPSAELSELGTVAIGSTTCNVTNAIVKNVAGNLVCIQFDLDGTVSVQTAGYSFWTSVNLVADL